MKTKIERIWSISLIVIGIATFILAGSIYTRIYGFCTIDFAYSMCCLLEFCCNHFDFYRGIGFADVLW